jgi:DNA-directed RNA polymerase sigma subunit (sigma70/sigma32)
LPLIEASRLRGNAWDATRYARIVEMIEGAVNELLTDDQRMVIVRKYFDRDSDTVTFKELAARHHVDRGTISRWHKEALRRLSVALAPLSYDEMEIHNLDWMLQSRQTA